MPKSPFIDLFFRRNFERVPRQSVWGQGRSGRYSPLCGIMGDYIPDRPGGADTVDTSGGFFTAEDGTVYYPITAKNSKIPLLKRISTLFSNGDHLAK